MTDYVYFIEAENGLVKIGCTNDIEKRLVNLQNMSPIPLNLLLLLNCDGEASRIENALHRKLEKQHHHGEWFNLSDEKKKWIKQSKTKLIQWATWLECDYCDQYYEKYMTLRSHQKLEHGR